jgi:quercetin dioxygenase-like cupin family protein
MDTRGFEAALVQDGYRDIETKTLRGDYRAREHSHAFDVRALVLAGEITLTWNGAARSFATGDVFTKEAGCPHAEAAGPDGVRYVVGRRPRSGANG